MNPSLIKALGAAVLLHMLAMGLAGLWLPPRPGLDHATVVAGSVEFATPIDIEFLAPPLPPALPMATSPPAPSPLAPSPPADRPPTRIATTAPPEVSERGPGPIAPATQNPLAPSSARPEPGTTTTAIPAGPSSPLLAMRSGPTAPSTGFVLDTRLALSRPGQDRGPGSGPNTPGSDILRAPGEGRGNASPWQPSRDGSLRANNEPFHAKVSSDGRIEFGDRSNVGVDGVELSETMGVPVLAGHFDVTDAVMAALGETLYPYRKLKLMDESREMRAGMARADNENNLRQAIKDYKRHLEWLWSQNSMSLWERKKALFSLWDECAEDGSESVLASARSIRAMTLAFIQRRLPVDSKNAFTTAELTRLNERRRSADAFAPY